MDLKRRIPVVAEWTDVGTKEMERGQARTGLSDEKFAHMIPVSAKTWSRWKKRGRIPTHSLPKVAPLLGFELVPFEPVPLEIPGTTEPLGAVLVTTDLRESLATIVDLLQRMAETMERSEDALGRIEQAILAPGSARRRARPGSQS